MMDWERLFKRYVWDEERTPYFTPVKKLTQVQAGYEIQVYTVFLGALFGVVMLASLTDAGPHGRIMSAAVYGLSVVCAALVLGFTKNIGAAYYCGFTPLFALVYFYWFGFHPNLGGIDHMAIIFVVVLWARYGWRIISIGRHFAEMPRGERPQNPRRRIF